MRSTDRRRIGATCTEAGLPSMAFIHAVRVGGADFEGGVRDAVRQEVRIEGDIFSASRVVGIKCCRYGHEKLPR